MIPNEVLREFRSRRVIVTGGTGMIGRQIVTLLCDAGARVRSVSLDRIEVDHRAEHVYGDLADFGFCKEATRDADFVVHAAGIKGSVEVTKSRPASFFVPLLMMNTNLLEACRVNGTARVVYTSSIGAYASAEVFREADDSPDDPPMDHFPGWAKRMAEMQIQAYRIQYGAENFAVVRLCNVYGPGDNFNPESAMVVPALMARIRAGEKPLRIWGDGSAIRDIAYSRDVAEGVLLALHHGTGETFLNLGSGAGVSIRELVEALEKVIGFDYVFDSSKPAGFPRRVMDIAQAREHLGYDPSTPLEQGLRATWEWFLENEDEHERKVNYFHDR
jgi:GDP-L-fucose synthase